MVDNDNMYQTSDLNNEEHNIVNQVNLEENYLSKCFVLHYRTETTSPKLQKVKMI
jgi:hypothetical protein